ncbi:hypothetical protein U9M48_000401 [Paspalum notatum var. saurae]|uniref:FAD-binding FR-type domain-containing protein n=1 Tax=Paspalum notatum var. saurae TaxID=547442 RepID=A0AAQ3PEU1_PASNO
MALAAAISAAATSVFRLNSSATPIAMASVVSMLPRRQPRLHLSSSSTSPPLPLLHRRRRSSSKVVVYASLKGWSSVPVSDIRPANAQESIYLITLDLSDAPILLSSYKTPGQYVLTRVPSAEEKRKPAYMSICTPPRSGTLIQLLVRSVPNTTSELLCNLKPGDAVELGPCVGQGFFPPIDNINPPEAAMTVVLLAVEEGISPIRALIKYGFAAKARDTVMLYYGASSDDLMPLRDEVSGWQDTGVTVQEVIGEPVQVLPFFQELSKIIVNPDTTAAILVGPKEMEEEVVGKLTDLKVPHDKILTCQGRYPGSSQ